MRRIDVGPRRSGFTLVELMVVIAIILALLALSASAIIKYIGVQQNNNTQTTLNKVQSLLNSQWSAAERQATNSETIPLTVQQYILGQTNPSTNLAGTDANVMARMRVIYVKLKMRQIFPMNFGEALNVPYNNPAAGGIVPSSPLPAYPAYAAYLAQYGINATFVQSQTAPQPYESAVCLLMALERAQSGGGAAGSDIGGGGSKSVVAIGSYSVPLLVDAWGLPIYFTRVPAGYPILNPLPYPGPPGPGQTGINDPGDPQGLLNARGWPSSANTKLFTALTLQPLAAQDSSYKLTPMVASGGPDKYLSDPLWFTFSTTGSKNDNDNFYSNP